jgi:hypothetical protein
MASPRGAYEASASETEETRSEGEVPLDRSLLFGADASGSPRASCADRADIGIDDAWFKRQSFDGHFEPFAVTFHDDAWGDARAFEASDSVTSEGGRSSSASTVRAEATFLDADDADEEAPRRDAGSVAFETRPDDLDPDLLRRIRYLTQKEVKVKSSSSRSSFDDDDAAIGVRDETLATPRDLFLDEEADDDDVWFADADDDAARRLGEDFSRRRFEDEDEDDASSDTFFAAILELYDNWSPSDQRWFLWRSGRLDGVRGSARLRRRLLLARRENDRFRDAFPNARDAGDPEDATRRVLDAFVRVFGRTPKTGNDFRLCVRPYAARDIASGGIAEIVHPEKMGWREIEVANGETRFSIARTARTSREEEEGASGGHDVSYTYETRLFRRTCLYFDAQGWCPLGTRCPAKAAHVAFFNARHFQRGASSRAREALRARWDAQDDPNAPSDFRRDAYPYVSFRGTTHANTRDARDGDARTFERLVKARSRRSEKVSREEDEKRRHSNV